MRSHVSEVSGPVVLVEAVDTVVDDVEIRVAIAVVIDELRSHPHSPPVVDAAAGRLVAEVPRRVLDPQLGGPLLIWNVQVQPAIAVRVAPRSSGAEPAAVRPG